MNRPEFMLSEAKHLRWSSDDHTVANDRSYSRRFLHELLSLVMDRRSLAPLGMNYR
jgi:hypothetical protein